MGNVEDESRSVEDANDALNAGSGNPKSGNSGTRLRLAILLGVFIIVAGGIWGGQEYLKSTVPKSDENFIKEKAEGVEEETKPSNLAVLKEIIGGSGPSKEITELQGKSADEVVFTYDEIMQMTPEELETNIKEVSEKLVKMRSSLPPSIGGATAGGSSQPSKDDGAESANGEEKTVTIPSLALPLEVMQQVAAGNN